MNRALVAFMALLFSIASSYAASPTATLLKTRASYTAAVTTGKWQSNFHKAKKYATDRGLPFIAVWSNGDACGHCVMFENGCNTSYFKKWMASSGMVFYFTYYGDKGNGSTKSSGSKADNGREGGDIFNWIRANKNTGYPFVRIYWPKGKVDVATIGDTVDGNRDGSAGAKNTVAYIKKKCAKFVPTTAVVKPYYVDFDPNGGTGEMARVTAKVGTSFALPANTFVRTDYSFLGWAKTESGAVAYKNKASVKNLTSVSNGVVTLYAKWRRITYRTYYIGVAATITMGELKGWKTSSKVPGLKWTPKTGKWTGKPTKAGTYTVKFKKGSSSATRKIVVVKDAIVFADEDYASKVIVPGEPFELDLTPASAAGTPKSSSVTGLPAGLSYAGGRITGTTTQVGTFTAKVTIVSATGQTLTRAFKLEIGVPGCCVGEFNGFVGIEDTSRSDVLAFLNRGIFRMSAPANASLSAKIVTAKGTYSLTGTGWTKNGDGTYTATLASSTGKDVVHFTVPEVLPPLDESFCKSGVFAPSYGTSYDVWAQRAPFERNASGAYLDETVAAAMPKVVGTWYFKVYSIGSEWQFAFATSKTANLTLTVSADGLTKLAGTVGSYKVSASSAVFVFTDDVDAGFVRADFAVPVTVSKTKKTLDIWLNLWFDKSNVHFNARNEGIGAAVLEEFK